MGIAYDANNRPHTTTAPTGAITTFTYNDTTSPPTKVATTNSHWVRTTMDGLGRATRTETGNGTTTVSTVDTQYVPCGCSPLGKVGQTSQPYAPGGTVYWAGATGRGLGLSHSYIKITSPIGGVVTIEGNEVTFAGFFFLVANVGDAIPSDATYANRTVEDGAPQTIPCAVANWLEDRARNFHTVPYNAFAGMKFAGGGYNSNSFMHWFLDLAGWVDYYANTPAENGIGWNAFPIPYN